MPQTVEMIPLAPSTTSRSQLHQVLLANVYNKSIFFHLNPYSQQILIYELDPTFSYKNQHAITLPNSLYQMQVIENMLVVHDLKNGGSSQMWDLKLPDYATGVLGEEGSG